MWPQNETTVRRHIQLLTLKKMECKKSLESMQWSKEWVLLQEISALGLIKLCDVQCCSTFLILTDLLTKNCKDNVRDQDHKDQEKDFTFKDKNKDLLLVLKESLRTRNRTGTNTTGLCDMASVCCASVVGPM